MLRLTPHELTISRAQKTAQNGSSAYLEHWAVVLEAGQLDDEPRQ